jgi:hypothetical protein
MTRNKTVEMLASLMDAGLIEDHLDGGFTPHNWLKRQYKSDVSTERVKRFRNAHETFQKRRETKSETPPDTDTDTDTDTTATAVVQKPPSPPPMKCSFPDWEQSAFAIVERFPTTDAATVMRIIECGVQAHVGAAQHGTNLTDKILSTIIGEVTTEGQHNAMLYLRTLPTAVSNMVRIHERRKVNGRV